MHKKFDETHTSISIKKLSGRKEYVWIQRNTFEDQIINQETEDFAGETWVVDLSYFYLRFKFDSEEA
jgi:hypothetical protein